MPKVTLVLHGKLKEHHAEDIVVHADTIREALTAMKMLDAFNPAKQSKRFLCKIDGCSVANKLDELIETTELHLHCDQVHEQGYAQGSGNNPYVNIIIGIILVIVGAIFDWSGSTSQYGASLIVAGVGMIVGGIMQLINPVDELELEESERNKSATSHRNTVASGTPIPIILGKHKHAGHIFSLNTVSRSVKNVNLSGLVSDLDDFEGSWVTMHSQLSESVYNELPPGGRGGGGGGGSWGHLRQK